MSLEPSGTPCLTALRQQESKRIDVLRSLVLETTGLIPDLVNVVLGYDFMRENERIIKFCSSRVPSWIVVRVVGVDLESDEVTFVADPDSRPFVEKWTVWFLQPLSTYQVHPFKTWYRRGHCSLFDYKSLVFLAQSETTWKLSHTQFQSAMRTHGTQRASIKPVY
jgi:hypothetical protein